MGIKSEGAIRQKLKQVRYRHWKRFAQEHFKPRPETCKYNKIVTSTTGKSVGLCTFKVQGWDVMLCDPETPEGLRQAKKCPCFQPYRTRVDLREEFDGYFEDIGVLANNYPDIAALVWVLGLEDSALDLFADEPDEDEEAWGTIAASVAEPEISEEDEDCDVSPVSTVYRDPEEGRTLCVPDAAVSASLMEAEEHFVDTAVETYEGGQLVVRKEDGTGVLQRIIAWFRRKVWGLLWSGKRGSDRPSGRLLQVSPSSANSGKPPLQG